MPMPNGQVSRSHGCGAGRRSGSQLRGRDGLYQDQAVGEDRLTSLDLLLVLLMLLLAA